MEGNLTGSVEEEEFPRPQRHFLPGVQREFPLLGSALSSPTLFSFLYCFIDFATPVETALLCDESNLAKVHVKCTTKKCGDRPVLFTLVVSSKDLRPFLFKTKEKKMLIQLLPAIIE